MARLSREMSKERLRKAVGEVMADLGLAVDYDTFGQSDDVDQVVDAVWDVVSELDDEDDLDIFDMEDED